MIWKSRMVCFVLALLTQVLSATAQDDTTTVAGKISYLLNASYRMRLQDNDRAGQYSLRALKLAESIDSTEAVGRVYSDLAWVYIHRNEQEKGYAYFQKSFDLLIPSEEARNRAFAYNQLGTIHFYKEAYDSALVYHFKAVELYQAAGAKTGLASTYKSISIAHAETQNQQASNRYVRKALMLYEELGDEVNVVDCYNDLAVGYSVLGQFDTALVCYRHNLDYAERAKDTARLRFALLNLGALYFQIGEFEEALDYTEQAIPLWSQFGHEEWIARLHLNAAMITISMEQYQDALKHLEQADQLVDSTNSNTETRGMLYQCFSELYHHLGDFELAYDYLLKRRATEDLLLKEERNARVAELEATFIQEQETLKREQLEAKTRLQTLRRNAVTAVLVLLAVIAGILVIYLRMRRKKDRLIADAQAKRAEMQKGRLEDQLEYDRKRLTSSSLQLIQRNSMLDALQRQLDEVLKGKLYDKTERELLKIRSNMRIYRNQDKDWEEFQLFFEQVHTGFFEQLKQQFPNLTSKDLRLAALIKLNMNTKEIAKVLDIAPTSVEMSRHRLRKKINLPSETRLSDFFLQETFQAAPKKAQPTRRKSSGETAQEVTLN